VHTKGRRRRPCKRVIEIGLYDKVKSDTEESLRFSGKGVHISKPHHLRSRIRSIQKSPCPRGRGKSTGSRRFHKWCTRKGKGVHSKRGERRGGTRELRVIGQTISFALHTNRNFFEKADGSPTGRVNTIGQYATRRDAKSRGGR